MFGGVVKTSFFVAKESLWDGKLQKLCNFRSLSDIEEKTFNLLRKNVQRGCQNCIISAYRNKLTKNILFGKNYLSYKFQTLSKKLVFCLKTSGLVAKAAIFLSIKTSCQNLSILDKLKFFYRFRRLRVKISTFLCK